MDNLKTLAQDNVAVSRWLIEAARQLLQRDPVDALYDVRALATALEADLDALFGDKPAAVSAIDTVRKDYTEKSGEFKFSDRLRFRWVLEGVTEREVLGWFEDDHVIVKGTYGFWRTSDPEEALRRARTACAALIGEA